MKFFVATVLVMLAGIAVATPVTPVSAVADGFDTISFVLLVPPQPYPPLPITSGACMNMNQVLSNNIFSVAVPATFVCTLYFGVDCLDTPVNYFGPSTTQVGTAGKVLGSYRCEGI